jgi:ATP-dependent helicase/nuclease subunit A
MPTDSILTQFKFTPDQKKAATRRSHAIAVTAGAGSGKTRVLVGRYLHLLEQGYPLRSLVAITFTDKAAREMRTRIRTEIQRRLSESPAEVWETAFTELDAARISTIHSLCAEVLRAHPAEAGLDPNFVVLEEGQAAAWQAQAIETALAWATTRSDTAPLIGLFTEGGLRHILATLIEKRLDVAAGWSSSWSTETRLTRWLDERLNAREWREALNTLAELRSRQAGDKLEIARRAVLDRWREVSAARTAAEWNTLFDGLFQLRKATSTQGQKGNWDAADLETAREAMATVRDYYDGECAPLIGKEGSLNWLLDQQLADSLPMLQQLHGRALQDYYRLKDGQQALDFDDLEGRAALLLTTHPAVRERWQQDVRAVLVDEFQDTNARQRDIVYALADFTPAMSLPGAHPERSAAESRDSDDAISPSHKESASQKALALTKQTGELFIVGDAKQSIYKFRGADVSVFRQVQADVEAADGFTVDLDLTFRAHQALVQNLNDLLRPVLGEASAATHAYEAPFAELRAQRQQPEKTSRGAPFVEFHLGVGEDAAGGREAAATALAQRLHTLHREEDFAWSDMALLFRASSGFGVYEDALERAGIPFVTIAGRGFYDRPEIRDLLNALAAIHDPTDDLALAGLLRSPAIGLSDANLYHLRFAEGSDQPRSVWETLGVIASVERAAISSPNQEIAASPSFDSASLRSGCAPRNDVFLYACLIITELHDLAGRVSVAEVLKRFLDLTHYRTLLSAVPQGHRLRRNVAKLLADAHASRLISLGEFLEYVQTLEDTGVREGEAPVEAGGAVQLLTVHKAKGLEFPVVVIADAAHEVRQHSGKLLLDDQLGLQIDLSDANKAHPIGFRLAQLSEQAKDEAEDKRLLYVAATRAKEKLIINGHVKVGAKGTLLLSGWLKRLGEVIGLDAVTFDQTITAPRSVELHQPIGCALYPPVEIEALEPVADTAIESVSHAQPPELVAPLSVNQPHWHRAADAVQVSEISTRQSHVWRVVPQVKRPIGPAWVIGQLTHAALRRWRFPDRDDFDAFLLPFALEAGLIDHAEIQTTIDEVRRMLRRFQAHPLYAEIAQADRLHEVPYALPHDSGVIDLLYRSSTGWAIVDFKTDEVRSIEEMLAAIEREKYAEQVQRYGEALALQIGQRPRGRLVFLRVKNEVQLVELP